MLLAFITTVTSPDLVELTATIEHTLLRKLVGLRQLLGRFIVFVEPELEEEDGVEQDRGY